ncbi:MAG TPA: asparaginase [Acidimicrobiia bacterium]
MTATAVALVARSGLIEAEHTASVAACDPRGRLTGVAGDVERRFFARSSAKPFQAKVAQSLGAALGPEQLAVACASHDGDPIHVALVREMLESAGLKESDLKCPPARPLSKSADRRRAAAGDLTARRVYNNCSGKHAAMLRACVAQGWDPASYLSPEHPLQQAVAAEMTSIGALADGATGIDGCGVPVFRVTTVSLARAFASLSVSEGYLEIRTAMHRFPALVSGVGAADAAVAIELHAVAKRGAEACLGVAVHGFGAIAVKVWDGSDRGVAPLLAATLDELGWVPHGGADRLGMALARPVLGGEEPVGSVRGVVQLREAK